MFDLALPTLAMMVVATAFLALERVVPGRELPHAPGWYGRAILVNLVQVAITFATNHLWLDLLSGVSLFHPARLENAVMQGFIGWFVGTFVFYWWRRVRPPGSPFSGAHRGPDRLLQASGGDSDGQRAGGHHHVPAARKLARGRALVQFFRGGRRALLSREHQDARLGDVFHPDPGVALSPSSARCPSLQLRRPATMGPVVRNLSRCRHVRRALRIPAQQRTPAWPHAAVPRRLQRPGCAALSCPSLVTVGIARSIE